MLVVSCWLTWLPCIHAVAQCILAASVVLERRARAQSYFGARCIAVARKSLCSTALRHTGQELLPDLRGMRSRIE
eukprot:2788464-Alexandrium_andersonii.AAC.1